MTFISNWAKNCSVPTSVIQFWFNLAYLGTSVLHLKCGKKYLWQPLNNSWSIDKIVPLIILFLKTQLQLWNVYFNHTSKKICFCQQQEPTQEFLKNSCRKKADDHGIHQEFQQPTSAIAHRLIFHCTALVHIFIHKVHVF